MTDLQILLIVAATAIVFAGKVPGNLTRVLSSDEVGTLFLPAGECLNGQKPWPTGHRSERWRRGVRSRAGSPRSRLRQCRPARARERCNLADAAST